MGLEVVWHILSWTAFVIGLPFILTAVLPKNWFSNYKQYSSSGGLGINHYVMAICWIIVHACWTVCAFMIYSWHGNFLVYPVQLLCFCMMVIVVDFGIVIFYYPSPQETNCPRMNGYVSACLGLTVLTAILFLAIDALSGLLMLATVVWVLVFWVDTVKRTQNCGNKFVPAYIDGEWAVKQKSKSK